ncbi:CotH kinase family protein [Candidatus Pelagibacter sp.]|nr:CotH kinase family protein [Candidatus Pelagibacter sp.]
MLSRYFRSTLIVIFIIIIISIIKNFINLHAFRGLYPVKIEIALLYEAALDTRSDIYRIFDKLYLNKKKDNTNIKKVYLKIKRGDLEKSQNNWIDKNRKKNYFKSYISFEENTDQYKKSNFRFRGRSDWHHRIDKPSIRVKLKHFEAYNMMRHLNFSVPEGRAVIENYYADILSKKIDLIGHYGEFVELYINKINYGIYHLHSREDESMIRLNKRMPSILLLGQNLNYNKWKINDFEIVNKKSITRNHNIFERMIYEINTPKNKWDNWINFWDIVNFEQTAKHIALNTILGNIHNDYTHNHEFFYDRTLGKVEPIISDALSLGTFVYPWYKDRISLKTISGSEKPDHELPINQKTNPFLNNLLQDTYFYHRKNQIINSLIKNELSYTNQHKLLNNIYNKIDPHVLNDPRKRYLIKRLNGWQIAKSSNIEYRKFKKNVYDFIEKRNFFLEEKLKQNFIQYDFINLKEFPNHQFLNIKYKGELPLSLKTSIFNNFEIYNPKKNKFFKYSLSTIDFHTGLKIVKNLNQFTNAKIGDDIFHDHQYETDYQTYLIKLDSDFDKHKFLDILKNKNVKIKKKNSYSENLFLKDITFNTLSLHIWSKSFDNIEDIVIKSGDHDIKEDIIVNKSQKLIIEEGARLLMWPNISIFSEGKISIDGGEKGITIINKFKDKPWGNLSVIGNKSNGSYINNTKISGGSTKDIKNILFSGMVNFFWNKDIILENLEINNNSDGDDTLHLTKSQGKIKKLKIYNCLSDCIDIDYSFYHLEDIKIFNSKNDGLDLMESQVIGKNLDFSFNMDKSISVGEASNLTIDGLKISNSNIGLASKDDSIVNLENVLIKNSNIGLDSYRKNSRYNYSGELKLKNSIFKKNKLDLRFDDPSKINFNYNNINYKHNK